MFLSVLTRISDFMWGTWMTVLLIATGLILSIRFGFRYNFRKIRFNFQNTFGKMFKKGEGTGTVSGFAAACTAMANTIGVGNIGVLQPQLCPAVPGLYSGCGFRGFWACPQKLVRSFSASGIGSDIPSPWTSTCVIDRLS